MRPPVAMVVATAIAFSASAHAEPDGDDTAFVGALVKAGFTFNSPGQAITSAKTVCRLLGNGESGIEVLKDLKDNNPGMTLDRAAAFTVLAANAYCPEHLTPAPKPAN